MIRRIEDDKEARAFEPVEISNAVPQRILVLAKVVRELQACSQVIEEVCFVGGLGAADAENVPLDVRGRLGHEMVRHRGWGRRQDGNCGPVGVICRVLRRQDRVERKVLVVDQRPHQSQTIGV